MLSNQSVSVHVSGPVPRPSGLVPLSAMVLRAALNSSQVLGGGHAGLGELVRPIPERALAVELDHDRVELVVDLADVEDAGGVVRLERGRIDAEVGDLLDRAVPGEAAQEADAGEDRDVRRVAAGDAGLEDRRVVRADGLVGRRAAARGVEGVEDLLERLLLAAAPQGGDGDAAGGARAGGRAFAGRGAAGGRRGRGGCPGAGRSSRCVAAGGQDERARQEQREKT